jgi:hypothetical protein
MKNFVNIEKIFCGIPKALLPRNIKNTYSLWQGRD